VKPTNEAHHLQVKQLYEEAERNGVVIIAGFQRRFDRNFKRLKDTITNNKTTSSDVGGLEVVRITSRDPSDRDTPFITQRDTSLEGFSHCLYDSLIHDFDMIQWLVGEDFEQIYLTHPHPDTISIQLKFPCGTLCAINWARSMKVITMSLLGWNDTTLTFLISMDTINESKCSQSTECYQSKTREQARSFVATCMEDQVDL